MPVSNQARLVKLQLVSVQGQGTEFTHQGQLNANGDSANGFYDFRFRLALDGRGNTYVGAV